MRALLEAFGERAVIAAVRSLEAIERAARSPAAAIFLLGGTILELPEWTRLARRSGKPVFLHIDLCEGLGRDNAAVEWCARYAQPDGVISTRAPLLRCASSLNLLTIQRLFLMDSSSLTHGVKLLRANQPDMVEVLPGLVPKAVAQLHEALDCPIIAGGMVTEPRDVFAALRAGACAVSTSEEALWRLETKDGR